MEQAGWGALDLAGNVWEWTADRYGDYPSGRQENPTGPSTGHFRVVRGGGWTNYWDHGRTAHRSHGSPIPRYDIFWFRCVISPSE
jgi:formylglycine-generating enzyme required for sulfatase activity